MTRRRAPRRALLRRLVLALAAVLLLAVVSTAPAARDTLIVGMPAGVSTFDTLVLGQVAEPLVRLGPDGAVTPWLLKSWTRSADGRTWTLRLRRHVRFTDGAPLDAEALRVNLERARALDNAGLARVASLSVVGERALEVTTRAPFAPFVNALADPRITVYSPRRVQAAGDATPVGTGPFKVARGERGPALRLEANERYWGGKPKLRAIVSRPYPDAAARLAALQSGEADLVLDVPPGAGESPGGRDGIVVLTPPSARVVWLYLNTRRAPFDARRVRQALYYAIDREAIVKDVFAGAARALHSPGPVGSRGYTDRYDRYGYNPEKARRLLAEAGVAGLTFTVHHLPGRDEVLAALQTDLARVGVTLEAVALDERALARLAALPAGAAPQAVLLGRRPLGGDIDDSLRDFGAPNLAFWRSDAFDRLLAVEQGTLDARERVDVLHRLQAILMDELPVLPLCGEPQIWAARRALRGVEWRAPDTLPPLHTAYFEN